MARQSRDLECLNHIATMLIDARKVFARAARIVDDQDVIDRLERTMGERDRLLSDIRALILSLRGAPQPEGSITGAAHQAFLDVRAIFDRDARAALAEVKRGERHLRDEMRRAIRNDALSAEVRAFLGLALDRVVNGEMRVEGGMEETQLPAAGADVGGSSVHR